jgi:hypothetical protein
MYLRSAAFLVATCLSLGLPVAGAQMGSMPMPSGKASMAGQSLVPPSQVFDKILSGQEKDLVSLAEAMPADKFDFAPSKSMGLFDGVSSFSAQVKHVASANYSFFRDFNVPGGMTREQLAGLTTRDQILAALKSSYQYAHAAIATITPENAFVDLNGKGETRAGMAAYATTHNNDHYGQLVEYLRMNGQIPPASRK